MKRIIALLLLIGIASGLMVISNRETSSAPSSFSDYKLISHAMGGIQEQAYTNSYEAFIANYEQGNRIFEVDLLFTDDGHLVARHEWSQYMTELLEQDEQLPDARQAAQLSYQEFKDSEILGKYKALDWDDILDLMEKYPDIYIVTDTKEQEASGLLKQFKVLVEEAEKHNPLLLQRIIPQIYNQPMLDTVTSVYDFHSIIYTLYESKDSDQEVIDFAKKHDRIRAITMPEHRVTDTFIAGLDNAGLDTYVHTINDTEQMEKYEKMGVHGFYTDDLAEREVSSTQPWYVLGAK
ncbi:glycerophosphoryl diester phosphodiesterase [Paenibacillus sp. DS2015]|uniref:phosphatidylinositol-specific phospholipase C/glycerophosphodiester phosphodiesterase family protein n=1 Tax=Paenibacillus sp. DS2015 TaxID=3373917 RepID=UPI003D1A8106